MLTHVRCSDHGGPARFFDGVGGDRVEEVLPHNMIVQMPLDQIDIDMDSPPRSSLVRAPHVQVLPAHPETANGDLLQQATKPCGPRRLLFYLLLEVCDELQIEFSGILLQQPLTSLANRRFPSFLELYRPPHVNGRLLCGIVCSAAAFVFALSSDLFAAVNFSGLGPYPETAIT